MNMILQITILYIVYLLMYFYTYFYLCIICVCLNIIYLLTYSFTYICLLLMYMFTYLRVYLFTYVCVLICNGKISISCWKVVIVWSIWCLFRSIIKIYVKFVGVFWINCFMCLFASLRNCLLESYGCQLLVYKVFEVIFQMNCFCQKINSGEVLL